MAQRSGQIIKSRQIQFSNCNNAKKFSSQYKMNDSLLYPCLVHLTTLIDKRERTLLFDKPWYCANLMIKHYSEAKEMFQPKISVSKILLLYYRQNWLVLLQSNSLQSNTINNPVEVQLLHLSQTDKLVCRIVARLLILGIQASIGAQFDRSNISFISNICEQLKANIIFMQFQQKTSLASQISLPKILLQFIAKLVQLVPNLVFLENMVEIFSENDHYQVVEFLKKSINNFRLEWKKNQQNPTVNKRTSRDNVFLASNKRNLSFEQKDKPKQNEQPLANAKSSPKINKTQKQEKKFSFKKLQSVKKIPQSSRRQTIYKPSVIRFLNTINSSTNESDFYSSTETDKFEIKLENKIETRLIQYQNKGYHESSQSQIKEVDDDILVDGTPERKKNKQRRNN